MTRAPQAKAALLSWTAMAAVTALLTVAGCGEAHPMLRLPEGALSGLPTEGQRWIYDAENAIVVALDGVDQAKEGLQEADQLITAAAASLRAAKAQQARRGTDLGVQAAQARQQQAELQRSLWLGRLALARAKVYKARADLELDRARMVVQYDLVAVRGFQLRPYEEQAAAAARAVDERRRAEAALQQKLRDGESAWQKAHARYVEKSGDHDSGVWLD